MTNPHHRERVLRGEIHSEHLVQLFDDVDTLADTLAEFLHDGWRNNDTLLVVARPSHWALTLPRLEALGCPAGDAIAAGRLVVLDAATTMAAFMVDGRPDPAKFDEHVGGVVTRLCAPSGGGLTIYGEMVDILAEQGELFAAEELEALWNTLGARCSFRLLCGYASANFADEAVGAHLRRICQLHTHVTSPQSDLLGRWLIADRQAKYHMDN